MIQVLGAKGMLGSAVCRAAERAGVKYTPDANDICTTPIIGDIVINCAGIVKQRQEPASKFMLVNAYAPHRIADECDKIGARLIHVSTDCVFTAPYGGPYYEHDKPKLGNSDVYALSKLAGEVTDSPHLTVRTSFVGKSGRGLIADLQTGKTISASNRLLWSGHTVDTVADALVMLAHKPKAWGILHIPGEFQTRFELVQKLARAIKINAVIIQDDSFVVDRRLDSWRWYELDLPRLDSFDMQLKEMFAI